jgi:hypothetical protein
MSKIEVELQVTGERKKPGRKPNPNIMSYTDACTFVQGELIQSRKRYDDWWVANKPKTLPRYPSRTYKEWTSWNDFLATNNTFNDGHKSYRPDNEAMAWAHQHSLKSFDDWKIFVRSTGKLPPDIPARPDLVYATWTSWSHFLGSKPKNIVEAKREVDRTTVFYIVQYSDVPTNVFTFLVEAGGISAIKDRQARENFELIKCFWYDRETGGNVKQLVDALSSPYYGDDRQRICPNVFEIIWHIQTQFETIMKI